MFLLFYLNIRYLKNIFLFFSKTNFYSKAKNNFLSLVEIAMET